MSVRSLATNLAEASGRAIEGLPSLPANPWRPRRIWIAGETIGAFGLGLAVGVGIGLLLRGPALEEVDPDLDGDPGP